MECLNHGLLSQYPVTYEKEGDLVAHVSGVGLGYSSEKYGLGCG